VAGDLLPRLSISTKVGFFPVGNGRAEHSLDPGRLLGAVEATNADLGRSPDLVLLHNPERSLVMGSGREELAAACNALRTATATGLCSAWGVSSWDPTALVNLVDRTTPRPDVVMVRAGLTVGAVALGASETLAAQWQPGTVWGMSPFGGDARDPVWDAFDPRAFLRGPGTEVTRLQAAFRVAYDLPTAGTVAVGADAPAHLRELLDALDLEVDASTVRRYRALLRGRNSRQSA
jgi:aryl-alcohol dehydrogenase-like predicted oxidoreductase